MLFLDKHKKYEEYFDIPKLQATPQIFCCKTGQECCRLISFWSSHVYITCIVCGSVGLSGFGCHSNVGRNSVPHSGGPELKSVLNIDYPAFPMIHLVVSRQLMTYNVPKSITAMFLAF